MDVMHTVFGLDGRYFIFGAFLLLTFIIGFFSGGSPKTLKEYALANRRLGTGVLTITFLATYVTANDMLGVGYLIEPTEIFMYCMEIFFTFSFGIVAHKLSSYQDSFTMGGVMETLYGRKARQVTGIAGFLFTIFFAAAQLVGIGAICTSLLDLSKESVILVIGIILTLYTSIGGMRSIAFTDLFQFIGLIVAVALIANVSIQQLGSFKVVLQHIYNASTQTVSDLPQLYESRLERWVALLSSLLIIPTVLVSPPFTQRMLMNRHPGRIRHMFATSGSFLALLLFMLLIIGFSAKQLYPNCAPGDVMLHVIGQNFGETMQALLGVCILAVAMSSADSFLSAAGLALSHDVITPFLTRKGVKFNELSLAKWATCLVGGVTVLAAYYGHRFPIYMFIQWAFLPLGMLTIPFVAGVLGLKVDTRSLWLAVAAFVFATLAMVPRWGWPVDFYTIRLFLLAGFCANGIAFFFAHILQYRGVVTVKRLNRMGHGDTEMPVIEQRWQPSWQRTLQWVADYAPTPGNMLRFSRNRVKQYGESAYLFSVFTSLLYLLPYLAVGPRQREAYLLIGALRAGALCLCVGLMVRSVWPNRIKKAFFPFYWHFTLLYCLPFMTALLFFMGVRTTTWGLDLALAIMLLVVLVDWISFLVIAVMGICAALAVFYLFMGEWPLLGDFETYYNLFMVCGATTLVGLLFARRRERFAQGKFVTLYGVSRFLSHEVRNITNGMLTPSQVIRRVLTRETKLVKHEDTGGYWIPEKAFALCADNAAVVEGQTKLLVDVVRQLEAVVKEYAESLVHPDVCDMHAVVQEVMSTYPFERAQESQVRYAGGHAFKALIPKTAFQFVLHNIIRNAFVHGGDPGKIQIDLILSGRRLHVRDNGKGVAPQNLDRIFDMAFTTGGKCSTGIGLGFARLVVEWFGGELVCESRQGKNSYTEFIVEFPPVPREELE